MKAKLLKKLRNKFSENYEISRCNKGWMIKRRGNKYMTWKEFSLEDAKKCATIQVRREIEAYIDGYYKTHKHRHSFTFYPW